MAAVRFSVVMATYNGAAYLTDQLESIRRQTHQPFELVVCDDRSSDDTVALLEAFREQATFPVYIAVNDVNLGYGENFLKATSMAQGNYVCFCDQDDVWYDHKLEALARVISAEAADLLAHSALQVDSQLNPLPGKLPDYKQKTVARPFETHPFNFIFGFACCVRAALVDPALYPYRPTKQPHDSFACQIANTYGITVKLPDVLALYRRHDRTVSGGAGGHHDRSLLRKVKHKLSNGMAYHKKSHRRALQHKASYEAFLAHDLRIDSRFDWKTQTEKAIAYYDRLASAFQLRSVIHDPDQPKTARLKAASEVIRRNGYGSIEGGKGIGYDKLAKDAAHLLLS